MSFLGSEGGGETVEIGNQPLSWVGVERLPQFLEYRSQRSVSGWIRKSCLTAEFSKSGSHEFIS